MIMTSDEATGSKALSLVMADGLLVVVLRPGYQWSSDGYGPEATAAPDLRVSKTIYLY